MTNCVFTICTKNYIGLTEILYKWLEQYNIKKMMRQYNEG